MQIRLLCLAAAALTGCATAPTPLATEKISVAVSVACVEKAPAEPELIADKVWSETTDEYLRQRALRIDRARLLAYAKQQEAAIASCVKK